MRRFILCDDASNAGAISYVLVLRKWTEICPGAEFRCFVKEKHLVGNIMQMRLLSARVKRKFDAQALLKGMLTHFSKIWLTILIK